MAGEDTSQPPPPIASTKAPQMVSSIKLHILKKGEYILWTMKMEQYLAHTDYALWEVILNGNSTVQMTKDEAGNEVEVPHVTAQQILARIRERKAKSTLLMAILDEHLARFHRIKDVKTLWAAIKTRFGGVSTEDANQKFIRSLPLAWSNISLIMRNKPVIDNLDIDDLYNNLKVYEADIKGSSRSSSNLQNMAFIFTECTISTNELNYAYSVSTATGHSSQAQDTSQPLPPIASTKAPHMVSSVKLPILNKGEYILWTMKMEQYLAHTDYALWEVILNGNSAVHMIKDEAGNEVEVPPVTKSTLLMAIPDEHLARFHGIKDAKTFWTAIKTRFGDGLDKGYDRFQTLLSLLKIHGADDLEEIDLKWQVAMLSMRVKRFYKKTRRKLKFNGKELVGFDKTKIECFNCHRKGHFARDCKTVRNSGNMSRDLGNARYRGRDNGKRPVREEDEKSLVVQDGLGTYDWSYQVEEEATDFALMAFTLNPSSSLSSNSKDSSNRGRINDKLIRRFNLSLRNPIVSGLNPIGNCQSSSLYETKSSSSSLLSDEERDVDSGCSRHMTWNKVYLADYQEINDGGFVAFGSSKVTPKLSHIYVVKRIFRKSTTEGCQFFGRRLISWQCKKQTIIATSTTEAEYVAAANCCGQVPGYTKAFTYLCCEADI
nr:ribonuclease H-like domain-containing protein [Tanacetum cinerariifolium]